MKKKLKAPFIPNKTRDNFDPNMKLKRDSDLEAPKECIRLLKKDDIQNFFSGYYYSSDDNNETFTTMITEYPRQVCA